MYSVEGIPSHILQNIESIKANIRSIISNTNIDADFSSFLDSAINDIGTTFSSDFSTDSKLQANPYSNAPGISSNMGISEDLKFNQALNIDGSNTIKNAYDSFLKSDNATNEIIPNIANTDKNDFINKIKGLDKNTSLITDEEFFDSETLSAEEITNILKKKGSPYADMKFEGGKTVGQLIYDECHKAGNINKGPRTLNPAMILSIMGAESSFGKNLKNINNPFNVKVNGSFHQVKSFEDSLNIAVNTMYNWALERPGNSKLSLLDYAGDKYCENYSVNWKPSVERYFLEFSIKDDFLSKNKYDTKSVNDIISKMNPLNSMIGSNQNPISNIDLLSSMKNIGNISSSFGNSEE